jgi:hypothetical protein
MEKFMLLFRGSDAYLPGAPPEALQSLKQKMFQWLDELAANGSHVGSEPFETSGKLVSGARRTIHDSPYGQAGEVVGGCTTVQAESFAEAMEIAKACPILETNATIEVRPIQKMA